MTMIRGKLAYLNRLYSRVPFKPVVLSQHMEGASPPSVFIGRAGYPKVYAGPLIPNEHGDTSMMDMPEQWLAGNNGKATQDAVDIINFRLQLVRGKQRVHVQDARAQNKTTEMLQSIALAKQSVEIEADFSKMPTGRFLHEEMQPFGPSGPLKELKIDTAKFQPDLEKAYYDTDLLSRSAVINLYEKGLPFSTIQKAFSTGAFGMARNRKLVPTRWSITAVDDMLGLHLLDKVKAYPIIENYRVYEAESLNNHFMILLMPTQWQYESMEAWFPQIIGDRLEIYSDWEGFEKRKTYAAIGGCYYSARMAICELLEREQKQAGAILLRESYPGYIPLGVWNVRENMRQALREPHKEFESMQLALNYINDRMRIKMSEWTRRSNLLKKTASWHASRRRIGISQRIH